MKDTGDLRVGDVLGRRIGPRSDPLAVLLGFPTDEGVGRNRGRPGAAGGPAALRAALRRLTAGEGRLRALLERTHDAGDLETGRNLEADQQRLGERVAAWLARGALPIVLGGGHETAYGHFLGYVEAGLEVSILNIDAHPDVRPLAGDKGHSGSPFRQALLHPSRRCRQYHVAGLQPHATAASHVRFVADQGGCCYWKSGLTPEALERIVTALEAPLMASFDLDAVDASQAPGVSAPATGGMTSELWLHAAWLAGRAPQTRSLDLVELNPAFDVDDRTARLAAVTVWTFLKGAAERIGS